MKVKGYMYTQMKKPVDMLICICFNRLQMPCLMLLYMKKMKMLDKNSVCHWGRQEVGF
jgi:hypothetical protein